MNVIPTSIPDVLLLEPKVHGDSRGFFLESWHKKALSEKGLDVDFVQDNHSRSSKGVLRGMHYQLKNPQGKLVRVVSGAVFDVAVDIRDGSPYFGKWVGVELSADNHRQLYIPPGFAHGFLTLSDSADFIYKCTEYYDPSSEHGIAWDDSDIAIEWPDLQPSLSGKDQENKALRHMGDYLPVYKK